MVFEAGGGEDSSVWRELEPAVRERDAVRTMLYDRAGLGRSRPSAAPYRIDGEADALRRELDRRGIAAPVVLVAHSYGGFVTTIVAATDPRIAGVVLVDANLADFFDAARIERLLATYRPQFPALEEAAPELASVMIPIIEAYPPTVARLREVEIPAAMPVVDIVAERTWVETPEEIEAMRRAHRDFVAASPHPASRLRSRQRPPRHARPAGRGARCRRRGRRSRSRATVGEARLQRGSPLAATATSDTPRVEWPAPLTVREVAGELGCSEDDVRALIRDGELQTVARGIRPGLVPRHQLDDYLRRRRHRLKSSTTTHG